MTSDVVASITVMLHDEASARLKEVQAELKKTGAAGATAGAEAETGLAKVGKAATLAVAGFGLAAAAGAAFSVKVAADLQEAEDKIRGFAGASDSQMKIYSKGIMDASKQFGVAAKDVADATYFVVSAGFQGADAMKVLNAGIKASAASGADSKTVLDALTSSLKAYHLGGSDAARITDELSATVVQGKTNFEDLARAIARPLTVAPQLGASLAEVGGAMAQMTDHGFSARLAAMGLTTELKALLTPTTMQKDEAKALGLQWQELYNVHGKGLVQTLKDIYDAAVKNTSGIQDATKRHAELNQELKALLGNGSAMATFLLQAGDGFKELATKIKGVSDSAGTTDRAWKVAKESFTTQMKLMTTSVQDLQIEIGDALLPSLTRLVQWITSTVVPAIQNFGQQIGAAWDVASSHGKEWDKVRQTISDGFGSLGDAIALATGKVNDHSTAIEKARARQQALQDFMKGFVDFLKTVADGWKAVADTIKDAVIWNNNFAAACQKFQDSMGGFISNALTPLEIAWDGITNKIQGAVGAIQNFMGLVGQGLGVNLPTPNNGSSQPSGGPGNGSAFGLSQTTGVVNSSDAGDSSFLGGRAPGGDTDYLLRPNTRQAVKLPGGANLTFKVVSYQQQPGIGGVEQIQGPDGARFAYLHLSQGVKPGTYHGGQTVGTTGWPTDPKYGNGVAGPNNAQLCVVFDQNGNPSLRYLTPQQIADANKAAGKIPASGGLAGASGQTFLGTNLNYGGVSVNGKYSTAIMAASRATGVPPAVIAATIMQESSGNPNANSYPSPGRVDAGLGQLSPAIQKEFGVTNPYDPNQNIMGTAKYLAQLHKQRPGDWANAVAGYNPGDPTYNQKVYGRLNQIGYTGNAGFTAKASTGANIDGLTPQQIARARAQDTHLSPLPAGMEYVRDPKTGIVEYKMLPDKTYVTSTGAVATIPGHMVALEQHVPKVKLSKAQLLSGQITPAQQRAELRAQGPNPFSDHGYTKAKGLSFTSADELTYLDSHASDLGVLTASDLTGLHVTTAQLLKDPKIVAELAKLPAAQLKALGITTKAQLAQIPGTQAYLHASDKGLYKTLTGSPDAKPGGGPASIVPSAIEGVGDAFSAHAPAVGSAAWNALHPVKAGVTAAQTADAQAAQANQVALKVAKALGDLGGIATATGQNFTQVQKSFIDGKANVDQLTAAFQKNKTANDTLQAKTLEADRAVGNYSTSLQAASTKISTGLTAATDKFTYDLINHTGDVTADSQALQAAKAASDLYTASVDTANRAMGDYSSSLATINSTLSGNVTSALNKLTYDLYTHTGNVQADTAALQQAQSAQDAYTNAVNQAKDATLGLYDADVKAAQAAYQKATQDYENAVVAGVTGSALQTLFTAAVNAGVALNNLTAIPQAIANAVTAAVSSINTAAAAATSGAASNAGPNSINTNSPYNNAPNANTLAQLKAGGPANGSGGTLLGFDSNGNPVYQDVNGGTRTDLLGSNAPGGAPSALPGQPGQGGGMNYPGSTGSYPGLSSGSAPSVAAGLTAGAGGYTGYGANTPGYASFATGSAAAASLGPSVGVGFGVTNGGVPVTKYNANPGIFGTSAASNAFNQQTGKYGAGTQLSAIAMNDLYGTNSRYGLANPGSAYNYVTGTYANNPQLTQIVNNTATIATNTSSQITQLQAAVAALQYQITLYQNELAQERMSPGAMAAGATDAAFIGQLPAYALAATG